MVEEHKAPGHNGDHRSHQRKIRIGMTQIMLVAMVFLLIFFITLSKMLISNDNGYGTTMNNNNQLHEMMMNQNQNSINNQPPKLIQPEPQSKSTHQQPQNAFHFIVSSDCTSYQRWEVLTQLHSAQNVQQCGRYTWIVSGCLNDGDEHIGKGKGGAKSDILTHSSLLQEVEKHFPRVTIANDEIAESLGKRVSLAMDNSYLKSHEGSRDCHSIHPHVHFTQDFSDMSMYPGPYADGTKKRSFLNRQNKTLYGNFGNTYKFNNKPNGLYHWIQDFMSKEGGLDELTGEYEGEDEAVVLIDPDFLFLNKFEFPVGNEMVRPGKPAAAKYGLGGQFLDFNLTRICDRAPLRQQSTQHIPCPFQTISNNDVNKYYSAGPPYVIHIQDVLRLSQRWVQLVPPTFDEYPLLYAEMFAYSMAAADLNLKHNLIQGLYTGCMTGWPHTHGREEHKALELSAKKYASLIEASPKGEETVGGGAASCFMPPLYPPPFLHYCQRYIFETPYKGKADVNVKGSGGGEENPSQLVHFFAKRRVDHDILDCNHDGPLEPFIEEGTTKLPSKNEKDWHVLAVCATVRAINYAKRKGCLSE